jgi:O-antigen ligase
MISPGFRRAAVFPRTGHAAAALMAVALLPPLASLGAAPIIMAIAVAAAAAAAPAVALLGVTAFLPLAPTALPIAHIAPAAADGVLIAVAGGLLARAAVRPFEAPAPHAFAFASAAFAVVVAASLGVQIALAGVLVTPDGLLRYLIDTWRTLYIRPADMPPAVAAVETIALLALAVRAAGWASKADVRASIVRTAVASGAASGLLCAARALQIALRTGHAMRALPEILTSVRISGPFSDPNAAGSYFVMLLVPAVLSAAAAKGWPRAGWLAASLAIAFGLWTSGSRAAVLVALAALGVGAIARSTPRLRTRLIAAAGALAITALVLFAFPNPILTRTVSGALGIRAEMAKVAVKMWQTDPWIGVGIGTFYDRSGEFITDPLVKSLYGRENAHNNFLQILGELGVLGLLSFAAILWTAAPRPRGIDAVSAGLAAFLVTCLAGHPLLLPEVAAAFWTLAGVAAARNASAHESRAIAPLTGFVAIASIVAVLPSYSTERAVMNLEHLGSGVSAWQIGSDGVRYRSMLGSARVFAPRATGQIAIPLRAAAAGLPVTVSVAIEGQPADRVQLSSEWRVERLQVPSADGPAFLSVDIDARDSRGEPAQVDVGRVNAVDVR